MATNSVRRRSGDIISDLPDEVLVQILSSIPTKDVVKTSILSKRWRSLWTSVDAVEITDFDLNSPTASDVKKAAFMNFVDNVLNQAVVVRKLGINFSYLYDRPRVKQWINIVNSKLEDYGALDELDLKFIQLIVLPPRIFTCKKLVILKLSYYTLIDVPSSSMAVWLPSLKVIHFNSLSILDVSIVENILAGCPVLEKLSLKGHMLNSLNKESLCVKSSSLKSLTLSCNNGTFNIEIEVPNLEELDVYFNLNCRIVIVNTDLPLLKRLKYDLPYGFGWNPNTIDFYENAVMEFLRKTPNIKYMFLSSDTGYFFKYSCLLKVLPMFKNLMHLQLNIDIYNLPFLNSLLRLAPNLVSFVLHSKDFISLRKHFLSELEQFCTPDNNGLMLEFLETVEIIEFHGSNQEMDLVTYFLKNAPVLKKMTILFLSGEMAASLHSRIVELPKTSMACQVILQFDAPTSMA